MYYLSKSKYNNIVKIFSIYLFYQLLTNIIFVFAGITIVSFGFGLLCFGLLGYTSYKVYKSMTIKCYAEKLVWIFGLYNLIICIISIFRADNTYNAIIFISKFSYCLILLLPFAFYNSLLLYFINSIIVKFWVPLSLILVIIYGNGKFVCPSQFLCWIQIPIMLFPFIKGKDKIISFIAIALMLITRFDERAFVLLIISSLLFYIICYRFNLKNSILKNLALSLIYIPIFLSIIAYLTGFNPFRDIIQSEFTQDSRTGLYIEVAEHIEKNSAYLFGTPGKGYYAAFLDTVLRNNDGSTLENQDVYKYGRLSTECGILNYLLHGGMINIIILTLMFISIIIRVFKYSKNKYSYFIAIMFAFRYSFMFIDGTLEYSAQMVVLAVMIAVITNKKILLMDDEDINDFFKVKPFKIPFLNITIK